MARFLNHYHCDPCNVDWSDEWECQCDDDCPECGIDYSPVDSEDLDDDENQDEMPCAACAVALGIDELDAKPTMTLWLRILRLFRGQLFMLRYAADRGYDFNRLECRDCYGPGYEEA